MRLRQLNLTRYGRFTDFTLDFGERPANGSDFHIIFGNNEAGKSTAFNGYLDLLFGIGERSKFNFLHEYNALCIGAVLEIEKTTIKLARIKRRGATLLGANNQSVDEAILTTALHGLSREAYEAMFSLNDKTLEQGGNEILESKGDFGRLLFAGTAGLTDLSKELQLLQDHANEVYSERSRKHEFASLLQQLNQVKVDRKNLDTLSSTYKHLTETHHKANETYQRARDARDNIRIEQTSLKKLKDAFAIQDDLVVLEKKLSPINHLPDVPKGWIEEVKNLQAKLDAAEEKKDAAQIDIDNSEEELENLTADPIIKMKGAFATLATLASHDQAAGEQLPKLHDNLLKVNADLEEIRQRLGANKTTKLADLVIPDDTIADLDTLSQKEAQLMQRLDTARQEVSDAKETLLEAKKEEKLAAPPDEKVTKLVALFDRYTEGDAEQCLDQAEQTLSQIGRKIQRELVKLAPWAGKQDNISSQAFPTPAQANRWCEKSKLLEQELTNQKTQQKQYRMCRTKHEGRKKALLMQMGDITDANAANSRTARDNAWTMHRERLDDETADAFEKVLIVDDHIHEERLAATDRLALLRNVEIELAEIDSTLKAIADEITQIEGNLQTFQSKIIRPVFIKVGLPKDFPVENLPPWLERVQHVRDLIEEEEEHCAERDLARSNYDQQRVALLEALTRVGKKLSKNSTLGELFIATKPYQKQVIKGEDRHVLAKKAVSKAEAQLRHRGKVLKDVEDEFEKWEKNWKHTVEGLWLRQKNISQIRALLTPLRKLTLLVTRQSTLIETIRTKERDCHKFRDEVCKLVHSLKLKVQEDVKTQFSLLQERFENAQIAETSRAVAARSRADAEKQLMQAETELSRIENRVKEMTRYFPTSEGITTLDNLAHLLNHAKEKFELVNAVSEKERLLLRELGVEARSDAEIKLKDKTLLDIETRLTKIDADLEEADLELESRVAERQDAIRAIEAISDDASVALLDEKYQSLLLEISNKANRALALHLGLMAADSALVAYRDRHRSELLTQTADAFRAITAGEFSRLITQPDQSCDRLIAIRSNGGSIAAEEMSKGTRFQLYLSLRLAAYRQFCNGKGPLPFFGDDIMETFDDHRAEAAMRQLSEIARNGQVLYFTHHRHLCEIAKNVFGERVIIHEIPKQLSDQIKST